MESHDDISESPQPQELEQQASTSSTLSPVNTLEPNVNADQASLTHAFDRLEVREEHLVASNPAKILKDRSHERLPMAERMFSSLEVIFQHAIDESKLDIGVEDCRSRLRRAEEDSKQGARSIPDLQWIRSILDQLSQTRSGHITQAATVLADGARDDSWRLPFGQSGLLDFFLGLASAQATGDLLVASLRFIGNACADADLNRERAISPEYLPSIVKQLENVDNSTITVPIIYNISNDYDSTTNMQIAYAALGFLRNLALPTENKTIIGSQGAAVPIISSFWSVDVSPHVQHASVSLLRQLLNGCIGNVRWLLDSLSPDEDSPAYEKTYLSLLLLLSGRTDDIATRIEIGRTVATITRCLHSSSQGLPPQSTSAIMHRLYAMHTEIARPLAMMISQSKFPVIRSEGWFALALMARSQEGSAAVSEVFQQLEVFGILVSTITGQLDANASTQGVPAGPSGGSSTDAQSIQQVGVMRAKDRENALVLVNELLKNSVRLDFLFISTLHDLLL
ncbi:MAG: hypothetical protein Q9181_005445 [Wetmoreana brouardii]